MPENISIPDEYEALYYDIMPQVLKAHGARVVLTFFGYSIYCIIRLIVKGNSNDTAYLSYTDILMGSCAFLILSYIYPYISFNTPTDKLSLKRIAYSISEELLYWASFIIWFFFIYCISIIGFWSLHDFSYGFSFFPIIKFFVFGVGGIYGFLSFCHLINIARMVAEKKTHTEIIAYIIKYAQTKSMQKRYS